MIRVFVFFSFFASLSCAFAGDCKTTTLPNGNQRITCWDGYETFTQTFNGTNVVDERSGRERPMTYEDLGVNNASELNELIDKVNKAYGR